MSADAATEALVARARVYAVLSGLFRPPDPAAVERLRAGGLADLQAALGRLDTEPGVAEAAERVLERLGEIDAADLSDAYERIFEASGGLCCSPNETDHVKDSPQEGLRRTYELADVAGFYRAFGVEVQPGTERADHVAAELEFMHLLAVKEVVTIDQSDAEERAEICREAARDFLRDHLGRFAPRLAERLEEASTEPFYAAAGQLLDRFVAGEAQRLGAA